MLCYDGHVHAQLFPYVLTNTTGVTLLKLSYQNFAFLPNISVRTLKFHMSHSFEFNSYSNVR